ncbi:MAG TPA: ribbon-helix-helix protein, CopG family [Terriglobales bacterium]|nr:ribbon-helix-helix protein, CopG family [Terriglobales bacterium]
MALLDEKNLAAEAAKRARFRVHHVGTKLNETELRQLEVLAAKRKQTQAELIRRLVLREIEQDQTSLRPSAEMVEITACRLLVVNLLGPLLKGQVVTSEVFDGIVDMVKRQKVRVAMDRLKDHEARR